MYVRKNHYLVTLQDLRTGSQDTFWILAVDEQAAGIRAQRLSMARTIVMAIQPFSSAVPDGTASGGGCKIAMYNEDEATRVPLSGDGGDAVAENAPTCDTSRPDGGWIVNSYSADGKVLQRQLMVAVHDAPLALATARKVFDPLMPMRLGSAIGTEHLTLRKMKHGDIFELGRERMKRGKGIRR